MTDQLTQLVPDKNAQLASPNTSHPGQKSMRHKVFPPGPRNRTKNSNSSFRFIRRHRLEFHSVQRDLLATERAVSAMNLEACHSLMPASWLAKGRASPITLAARKVRTERRMTAALRNFWHRTATLTRGPRLEMTAGLGCSPTLGLEVEAARRDIVGGQEV